MEDNQYIYPSKERNLKNLKEKINKTLPKIPNYVVDYVKSLFPIFNWIHRYNLTWLTGDLIAGITVGTVLIPQGMAYAKIAQLKPEYGLYSSFIGVSIYCFFATSKDITLGPVAVMSLLMGQAINKLIDLYPDGSLTPEAIATSLCLLSGLLALIIGLFRLGIFVEFIPSPVIAGFTTGSAITIAVGQIAKLLGISGIDNKKPTYLVLVKTLSHLNQIRIDAALGAFSLLYLYALKYGCVYLGKRFPKRERLFFFISIIRIGSLVVICTLFSFLINLNNRKDLTKSPISILRNVPSGFKHIGVPDISISMIKKVGSYIPSSTIVLILEHIAIAKTFGRINDYKKLIAIGVTNIVGSFFGAYPATGSFSRTAIKAKSGVRTPIAGIFSGVLVILALFVLTPAFSYIPDASLSAIIIHAVLDLISSYSYVKQLWEIQFWDFVTFTLGVLVTIFFSTEMGIYVSTGFALLILLLRLARPRIDIIGYLTIVTDDSDMSQKHVYVPLRKDFPEAVPPPDGVLIFKFEESLTYPNSSYIDSRVIDHARLKTRRMKKVVKKAGDRPWNDVDDEKEARKENEKLPQLRAAVFDLSAVSVIDSTGMQALLGIKNELNKHAGCPVEYHFACINTNSIQRSLIMCGFGTFDKGEDLKDVHSNNDLEANNVNNTSDEVEIDGVKKDSTIIDVTTQSNSSSSSSTKTSKRFFHFTLQEAVTAATNGNMVRKID
ncbi:852_t:CDS:2 [Diversispora eburnea]|uniref:852_t:CDS:1 n=1 Tax=Diversispora eburnea TaxID=1213867 RepID=A0A9N8VS20_9GLOM|nr:852_t:CDS:2 [Diversispora eburnea]